MAVGAIPFEAIDVYATRYGIEDGEDFEEFHHLIRAADAAYLEAMNEKREQQRNTQEKPGGNRANTQTGGRQPGR